MPVTKHIIGSGHARTISSLALIALLLPTACGPKLKIRGVEYDVEKIKQGEVPSELTQSPTRTSRQDPEDSPTPREEAPESGAGEIGLQARLSARAEALEQAGKPGLTTDALMLLDGKYVLTQVTYETPAESEKPAIFLSHTLRVPGRIQATDSARLTQNGSLGDRYSFFVSARVPQRLTLARGQVTFESDFCYHASGRTQSTAVVSSCGDVSRFQDLVQGLSQSAAARSSSGRSEVHWAATGAVISYFVEERASAQASGKQLKAVMELTSADAASVARVLTLTFRKKGN